jgi:hypothetical protein
MLLCTVFVTVPLGSLFAIIHNTRVLDIYLKGIKGAEKAKKTLVYNGLPNWLFPRNPHLSL